MQKSSKKEYITKDMLIGEVVQKYPEAAFVMMQHGMHCVGCPMSSMESIEQGTVGHGMAPETLNKLIKDLNAFIAKEQEKKEA